jgi:hypothetical protein
MRAGTVIVAHVRFIRRQAMTLAEATALFERTAPKYKGRDGLLRKTYLLSEDGLTAGAVYFWRDRAAAERVYTDDWRKTVTEFYGVSPQITFYDAPVTVDNTE